MENPFSSPLTEAKEIKNYIICLEKKEFNSEVLLSKSHFSKSGHDKKKSILSLGN